MKWFFSFKLQLNRISGRFSTIFAERERERDSQLPPSRAKDNKNLLSITYYRNMFFTCSGFFMPCYLMRNQWLSNPATLSIPSRKFRFFIPNNNSEKKNNNYKKITDKLWQKNLKHW
jgi:hypothetical protein